MFQLQITRLGVLPYSTGSDVVSLVLPLVYDTATNITQLAEKRDHPSSTTSVSNHMKRFAEYFNMSHSNDNQIKCSIFPAVQDLITNLTLPSEPPGVSIVITKQSR